MLVKMNCANASGEEGGKFGDYIGETGVLEMPSTGTRYTVTLEKIKHIKKLILTSPGGSYKCSCFYDYDYKTNDYVNAANGSVNEKSISTSGSGVPNNPYLYQKTDNTFTLIRYNDPYGGNKCYWIAIGTED